MSLLKTHVTCLKDWKHSESQIKKYLFEDETILDGKSSIRKHTDRHKDGIILSENQTICFASKSAVDLLRTVETVTVFNLKFRKTN